MEKTDLTQFSLCKEGLAYYNRKSSFEEAWRDCERGDWMLWIAKKSGIDDRTLTRAKALCANTVRHLMTDRRSTAAVDAAMRYAAGRISRDELDMYANRATAATTIVDYTNDKATYYADYAAARAAADARAAHAAAAAAAHADAASASRAAASSKTANRRQTADICREVLTDAVFEKINQL